jgi:hypothetical protein
MSYWLCKKWKVVTDNLDIKTDYGLSLVSDYLEFHSEKLGKRYIVESTKVVSELVNLYGKRIKLQKGNICMLNSICVSSSITRDQIFDLRTFGVDIVEQNIGILSNEILYSLKRGLENNRKKLYIHLLIESVDGFDDLNPKITMHSSVRFTTVVDERKEKLEKLNG